MTTTFTPTPTSTPTRGRGHRSEGDRHPHESCAPDRSCRPRHPDERVAISTLMCTAVGTLLAIVLARRARRPAAIFVVVTTLLTIASFAGPITTGHVTAPTRLVLTLTHVVAAVIVVPALARRLAQRSAVA